MSTCPRKTDPCTLGKGRRCRASTPTVTQARSAVCRAVKGQPGVGPAGWPLLRPALMVAQGPERHGGAAGPILLCVAALLLRAGALEPLDDSTAEIAHTLAVRLPKIPDDIDHNQVKIYRQRMIPKQT